MCLDGFRQEPPVFVALLEPCGHNCLHCNVDVQYLKDYLHEQRDTYKPKNHEVQLDFFNAPDEANHFDARGWTRQT